MAQTHAGQPERAAQRLETVLKDLEGLGDSVSRSDAVSLRVSTLVSLALTQFLLHGKSAGLATLDRALADAEQAGDEVDAGSLRARIAYQRANIHGRSGDLALAWQHFEPVMARLDAFTDRERCSVLLNRGVLALAQSRAAEAADAFRDAAQLARETGSPEQEFMALHNGGYAAYLLGDLPTALSEMARADRLDARVSRGTARLDRGTVLLEAGLVSEALEVFRVGVEECVTKGETQLRADFHLELARAQLVLGWLEEAARAARLARDAYRRVGAGAWEARARLLGLRVELDRLRGGTPTRSRSRSRSRSRALAAAHEADLLTETAEALGDRELAQRSRTVAADALALAGEMDGARERLAGRGDHRHGSLFEELHHATVSASVLAASGDDSSARRVLSRAARTLAAGQRGSASLELRTARAVLGARLGSIDLDLARGRGSGAVLESLERWRSATDRLPHLGRPPDAELAALIERLRGIRARMREEQAPGEWRALQAQATRLERAIRDRDWTLSSGGDLTKDLSVRLRDARDVLTGLDRDLVWFFPHEGRLCGLGVSGGRASVRELMDLDLSAELAQRIRADLRAAATHHLGPLHDAVWRSLRDCARQLDDGLVRPWRLSGEGLVLVTCEEVAALPWALLPSLAGRPLTIGRSLTAFARRSSDPRVGPPPSVHVSVGPDVPRGPAEGEAVASAWAPVRVDRAWRSTSSGLVTAVASPGVVHVAAHGTHEPESPLFSSLALHDGPVFAHELQTSGVAADHVVLSACDVGIATHRPGDETLGLAASMLSLGARSVVAAVSPVPDDVAADVMARHHRSLASGMASDVALAEALRASVPVASAFVALGGRW